jgi:hypothetical protein
MSFSGLVPASSFNKNYVVQISLTRVAEFKSWAGPVGRSVDRLALETTFRQKVMANKKTGKMAASLHVIKKTLAKGIAFDAGSKVRYTMFMEQGTRPHKISAKAGGFLVFFWPKVGHMVYFKSVNHPGTRPYHFLINGLERALRMWERGG